MEYELSLWIETPLRTAQNNEYIREKLIGILGKNESSSPINAFDVQLEEKINGTKTLTFSMPAKYYDIHTNTYKDNPYTGKIDSDLAPVLVNGRLIKLKRNGIYENFVLDSVSKDSNKGIYTYSCNDANISQLSKTGYNIELDTELENNMGTIFDLATTVVQDIDWQVVGCEDTDTKILNDGRVIKSDLLRAYTTESLFVYTLKTGEALAAVNMIDTTETTTVPVGSMIYVTNSSYTAAGEKIAFFWREDNNYTTNQQRVITNSENWVAEIPDGWRTAAGIVWPNMVLSSSYCGHALTSTELTKYVAKIDKYCSQYTTTDGETVTEYYGYDNVEYMTVTDIQNMLAINSDIDLLNIEEWTNTTQNDITVSTSGTVTSSPVFDFTDGKTVISSRLNSCRAMFKATSGFNKSEKYILIFKPTDTTKLIASASIEARADNSPIDSGYITYYTGNNVQAITGSTELEGYYQISLSTSIDLSYSDVTQSYLQLELTGNNTTVEVTDIRLFREVYDNDNKLIVPDLTTALESVVKTKTYIFTKAQLDEDTEDKITSTEDLIFTTICYKESLPASYHVVTNSENYELITSIEAKESNRYNIIQDLCEKFQCWANFYVDTLNGESLYKYVSCADDEGFVPGKRYYEAVGTPTGSWFDDDHYKYADLSNYFTRQTQDSHYNYTYRDKYYVAQNNIYVGASLGHQWGEYYMSNGVETARTFYTMTVTVLTSQVESKTWTPATTYSSSATYYIKVNSTDYEAVSVGNEFVSAPSNYWRINETGSVWTSLYTKQYQKFITFNEYTGSSNLAGFKYGINLGNIVRKLDSDGIVTKLIVAQNVNDAIDGGFCDISDATQNYMGSNTIYNFNYYINYGLIDETQYTRDMYGLDDGDLAYSTKYQEWNTESKANTTELAELSTATINVNSQYETYIQVRDRAKESWSDALTDIQAAASSSGYDWTLDYCASVAVSTSYTDKVNSYITMRNYYSTRMSKYETLAKQLQKSVDDYNNRYAALNARQTNLANFKKALDFEFYQRYKSYIREGTWSSEDAYDPDIYYYDACQVGIASSYPEVSYTFKVFDLSDLDGWKSYQFGIGDKTYVRDVEFFSDQGTAQLEVVVSAIKWDLANPQNTTITVQNYSTQFQDIFQKVSEAVQTLTYNEAKYEKAGTIATDATDGSYLLSRILSNNSNIVSVADGKFTYDANGITAVDNNSSYQLKLTSHGLVVSDDGGSTWSTGVSAAGINTKLLTAGTIDVNNIRLYGGNRNKTFEWNGYGINAYSGDSSHTNQNRFVRFDKYGIYGVTGKASTYQPTSVTEIEDDEATLFSLTWKGLNLRSEGSAAYAKISVIDGALVESGSKVIDIGVVSGTGTSKVHTSKFYVTDAGQMYAKGGIIDGNLYANELYLKDTSSATGYTSASVLSGSGQISTQYLDLGGVIIDGENSQITIKPTATSTSGNAVVINTSGVDLQGTITFNGQVPSFDEPIAQALANGTYTGGTFINEMTIYTPSLMAETITVTPRASQGVGIPTYAYYQMNYLVGSTVTVGGYLGALSDTDGTETTSGVMLSTAEPEQILSGSREIPPFIFVTKKSIRIENGSTYMRFTNDGSISVSANGNTWNLSPTGGGGSSGTTIAVFG